MQKLLFSILLATICMGAIVLPGCKKNDASIEEKLVGKWTLVKLGLHVEFFGQSIDTTVLYPTGSFLEFKKDGTMTGEQDGTFTGIWKYQNSKLLTVITNETALDSISYDILKITGSDLQLQATDTAANTRGIFYLNK
jgi:hypothetical protein